MRDTNTADFVTGTTSDPEQGLKNDMMMNTRTATVILNKGARHMAEGDHTVCGFPITDNDHYDGNILRQLVRISCLYCARQATHPMNTDR